MGMFAVAVTGACSWHRLYCLNSQPALQVAAHYHQRSLGSFRPMPRSQAHGRRMGPEVDRGTRRFIVSLETMIMHSLGIEDTRGLGNPMPVPASTVVEWLHHAAGGEVAQDVGVALTCHNTDNGVLLGRMYAVLGVTIRFVVRLPLTRDGGEDDAAELEPLVAALQREFAELWARRHQEERFPRYEDIGRRAEDLSTRCLMTGIRRAGQQRGQQ